MSHLTRVKEIAFTLSDAAAKHTTACAGVSVTQTADLMRLRLARVQRGHEVRHHTSPAAPRKRELRFA